MKYLVVIIFITSAGKIRAQMPGTAGTYLSQIPKVEVRLNSDSTFVYTSGEHPVFYRWENFWENGKWAISGDTIILNPQLAKKPFVESNLEEEEELNNGDMILWLTFNHIKRYFGTDGNLERQDTVQIDQLDFSFNELKRKKITRVARHRSTRCTFAGYIPKEIITENRTISFRRPPETIRTLTVGCYEMQETKTFEIKNPNATRFTVNVYSNYYEDGLIRQMKLLVKNRNVLYTRQKASGQFEKDTIWSQSDSKLTRKKVNS